MVHIIVHNRFYEIFAQLNSSPFCSLFSLFLGRGCSNRSSENPGIAKIGLTPPPYPNPGTLVDLTTKARKCDSRHFDVKSA